MQELARDERPNSPIEWSCWVRTVDAYSDPIQSWMDWSPRVRWPVAALEIEIDPKTSLSARRYGTRLLAVCCLHAL